jgi:hypothetical protein
MSSRYLGKWDQDGSIDDRETAVDDPSPPAEEPGPVVAGADSTVSEACSTKSDEGAEDVFARLSQAGIWKGFDSSANLEADRPSQDSKINAEADHSPAEPAWKHHSTGSSSGDDSIESYMERLMERVRGESRVSSSGARSQSERGPRTEADLILDETPEEAGVLTESEYLPRSQAPELTAGLEAMRALGNDLRRNQIMRHARQKWAAKSYFKLAGSALGLGLALGSFFFLDSNTELAAIGLCVGLTVSGVWTWQAIRYRRQLFNALQLNSQPHPGKKVSEKPDEPPRAI